MLILFKYNSHRLAFIFESSRFSFLLFLFTPSSITGESHANARARPETLAHVAPNAIRHSQSGESERIFIARVRDKNNSDLINLFINTIYQAARSFAGEISQREMRIGRARNDILPDCFPAIC